MEDPAILLPVDSLNTPPSSLAQVFSVNYPSRNILHLKPGVVITDKDSEAIPTRQPTPTTLYAERKRTTEIKKWKIHYTKAKPDANTYNYNNLKPRFLVAYIKTQSITAETMSNISTRTYYSRS